jgi:ribosomal protein S18 acetylase RimI-like enzyme
MIELRKVNPTDTGQLQEISRQTFIETFAAVNTEENMLKYLGEAFSPEKLTAELSDQHVEFYFAMLNNEITGYLKINFGLSQTDVFDPNSLEIERIYVLQKFQGKTVGKTLFNKATEIAREKNLDYIWLGVWEENHNALSFYRKLGFAEFGKHAFLLGDDEQTDIMMRIPVR